MRFKAIVFGSGGMAKEVIGYLEDEGHWDVVGVVSTEPFNNPAFDKYPLYAKAPDIEVDYILAVSDPAVKRKIVSENKDRWVTFWHPSAYVSTFAKVGKGCVFGPQSLVCGDPVIGDFVFFNTNATVGHDTKIGDYSTLFPNSEICGGCTVGEDTLFGIGAYVLPNLTIASGAKVSAGAIVRKSVIEAVTVYGDPAQPRKIA